MYEDSHLESDYEDRYDILVIFDIGDDFYPYQDDWEDSEEYDESDIRDETYMTDEDDRYVPESHTTTFEQEALETTQIGYLV